MIALRGAVLLSDRGEVEHQPPTVEQFLMEGLGVGLVMRTRAKLLAPAPKAFRVPERTGWGIAQTTEPLIKVTEQHPVLRDIQGFSYEEIRDILKVPDGTVKSRLSRARNALKDCLAKIIGDI